MTVFVSSCLGGTNFGWIDQKIRDFGASSIENNRVADIEIDNQVICKF